MHETRRSTPLRADLRERRPPLRPGRLSRRAWWTLVVGGAAALIGVSAVLDQVAPGAGVALGLGLRWILALAYLGCAAVAWRVAEMGWRWRLVLVGVAAWFVARAALETYAALG